MRRGTLEIFRCEVNADHILFIGPVHQFADKWTFVVSLTEGVQFNTGFHDTEQGATEYRNHVVSQWRDMLT